MASPDFVGTWRLVSIAVRRADGGLVRHPMGPDPDGLLVYSGDGFMSVQIARGDRRLFESDDLYDGSPTDRAEAYHGYIAYCGRYTVDEAEGSVTHRVAASLFPNWMGTDQKRFYHFEGARLTLRTPAVRVREEERTSVIVWERVGTG